VTSKWVVGARPRTLPAAVVPVVVGTATAVGNGIIWWRFLAALVVALAIQIATNYVNDYADGERGTDDGRVGPVRLVAAGLASSWEVKVAAGAAALVAAVAGLALAAAAGWQLVLVGLASFAAGYLYTAGPRPYGYAGLGEVFVFVFFGLVATVGSAYVQMEKVTVLAIGAALPVGLLATALLVVNNLRDIPTDARSGKRTLAVRLGDGATRAFYLALIVGAFLFVPLVAIRRPWSLMALLAVPAALPPVRGITSGRAGMALIPVLGETGRLQLVFGALLAVGLALSG